MKAIVMARHFPLGVREQVQFVLAARQWLSELLSLPLLFMVLPPFLIGYQLANGHDRRTLLEGVATLSLLTIWGSILNHYADWDADAINGKRPFLHLNVRRSDLLRMQWVVLAAYLAVSVVSFWQSLTTFLVILLGWMGAAQYSVGLRFKDRLWLSYPYLALAYSAYPLLLGLLVAGHATQSKALSVFVIMLLLLFLDTGIAPFKDYEDQTGDRRIGKRTLPNVYGARTTARFQSVLIGLAAIAASLLAVVLQVTWSWVLVVFCLVLLMLVQLQRRISDAWFDFLHYAAMVALAVNLTLLLLTSD